MSKHRAINEKLSIRSLPINYGQRTNDVHWEEQNRRATFSFPPSFYCFNAVNIKGKTNNKGTHGDARDTQQSETEAVSQDLSFYPYLHAGKPREKTTIAE